MAREASKLFPPATQHRGSELVFAVACFRRNVLLVSSALGAKMCPGAEYWWSAPPPSDEQPPWQLQRNQLFSPRRLIAVERGRDGLVSILTHRFPKTPALAHGAS